MAFGPESDPAPFDRNQSFLDRDPWSAVGFTGESAEAIAADNPMARRDDRLWISSHRLPHGPGGPGMAGQDGDCEVGSELASRNAAGRPPHRSLEGSPLWERYIAEIGMLTPDRAPDVPHHQRRWRRVSRRDVDGLSIGGLEHVDPSRRDRPIGSTTNVEVAGRGFQNEMGSGAHGPTLAVLTSAGQMERPGTGGHLPARLGDLH